MCLVSYETIDCKTPRGRNVALNVRMHMQDLKIKEKKKIIEFDMNIDTKVKVHVTRVLDIFLSNSFLD